MRNILIQCRTELIKLLSGLLSQVIYIDMNAREKIILLSAYEINLVQHCMLMPV